MQRPIECAAHSQHYDWRGIMPKRPSLTSFRHFPPALVLSLVLSLGLSLACRDVAPVAAATADQASASVTPNEPVALATATISGGGGLRLSVHEGGNASGPSVVFIHGFTGNYLSWERQLSG